MTSGVPWQVDGVRAQARETAAAPPRADLRRAATQGLSSLEEQLRSINARVEALRPCAVETLRGDLAEIGRMIREAMPRRAIEALEAEVRSLTERVDSRRHAGADAADLAGVERGLAEVRDALRALTPAENLVGFDETVRSLSQTIDGIAPTSQDAAALEQLEDAIAGLRGIVSHVASNGALARLSDEVSALAARVEQVAGSDVFATLEQRITIIADALQFRNQTGQEAHTLEAVMQRLAGKLERLQLTHADHAAVIRLEDRIARLAERLDSSDARFGHLETIERGLAELLDRLAMIEAGLRNAGAVSLAANVGTAPRSTPATVPVALPVALPKPFAPTPATADRNHAPATNRRPIDPDLPPDHPLEPGVARGRNGHSRAGLPAASEASRDPTPSPAIPHPDAKLDFIAAARRAVQTAGGEPAGHCEKHLSRRLRLDARPASRLRDRLRLPLLCASVALIVLGSLQLLTGFFSRSGGPAAVPPESTKSALSNGSAAASPADDEVPAPPNSSGRQSALISGGVPFAGPRAGGLLPGKAVRATVSATTLEAASDRTTTASIAPPSAAAASAPPERRAGADRLPASIGSSGLRTAATVEGDPAAEFEVAVRFAEGRGVPADATAAAEWFERAANQGLPPAQFRLGAQYEKGLGVKKDLDRARRLYLAAAQAGHAKAMHNLAVLYAEGIDGKSDYQTAAKWFREAADHGVVDSQYNLGVLYVRGIGVETNLADAYKWFSLAARDGDRESMRRRDDVGARLDQTTVMVTRAAVQGWTAQPQPEAATQVKAPPGGWDGAPAPSAAKRRVGPDARAPRTTP